MIVLLLTGQEVNLEKCPLFPVRHMPAGCISIRSIILTRKNPNARGRWYADWLPGGKEADFAAKAFKEIYRRLTGI